MDLDLKVPKFDEKMLKILGIEQEEEEEDEDDPGSEEDSFDEYVYEEQVKQDIQDAQKEFNTLKKEVSGSQDNEEQKTAENEEGRGAGAKKRARLSGGQKFAYEHKQKEDRDR